MKAFTLFIALVGWLTSCTTIYKDPAPELVESEMAQMADCRKLGVISGTADAGSFSTYDAAYRMVADIKTRAVRMGATHIVWVDKNELAATAMAYECSSH